jgi:YidC/Oxa1 family membrane protein insertase
MMDRQTTIGFVLIFILLAVWAQMNTPTQAEIDRKKFVHDSIVLVQKRNDSLALAQQNPTPATQPNNVTVVNSPDDTVALKVYAAKFGAFAPAAIGTEKLEILENDDIKVVFSNKGGRIKSAELKKFTKSNEDEKHQDVFSPLVLMEDSKNKFEYILPVQGVGNVNSSDLFFSAEKNGNSITFRADAGNGHFFEQKYTLSDVYGLDYSLRYNGLQQVLDASQNKISLQWENYLEKLERNQQYERNYSSVYFKTADGSADYCNCQKDDAQSKEATRWISHSNQFFNSSLIATNAPFTDAQMATQMFDDKNSDLKKLYSRVGVPFGHSSDETFQMKMYIGPNEFDRLKAYNVELQDIIPFGKSFFGTINRWIIRPIFNFLSSFIGMKGLVILLLTFIVKAVLFPLTYKMLYSQSKMAALKPRLDKMREKFGDDQTKMQAETMKLYGEYGVNPLGGCLPMVLQMPIWIALYRFFPASIAFRQQSFLWAKDLTSFDAWIQLSFDIPFFGSHISLFTLLWVFSTLAYTYYSTKDTDFSAQPYMKYMQYIMPLMFMFAFNNYASGLTCYLVFSNLLNIAQTIITKKYVINQEKVLAELEIAKAAPKKQGFMSKLQDAQQMAQKMQEEKEKAKKKK